MARRQGARGFSLIELMIAVAVVGILAAIAYPNYVSQVRKGKRAECRTGLLQAMQQEERYFTQYNSYVAVSAPPATGLIKNFSGSNTSTSACNLSSATATTSCPLASCIVLQATPTQSGDAVTQITLDSAGNRGCTMGGTTYSGSNVPKDCWP